MIDEYWTWQFFGYRSDELKQRSSKPIIARCDDCCQYRVTSPHDYYDLCPSCAQKSRKHTPHTEKTKRKMVDSAKGRKMPPMTKEHKQNISNGNKGKKKSPHTKEHSENQSKAQKKRFESEEERRKTSEANMGNVVTDETKRQISATMQNISIEDWEGFACEQKYCPKFNESIKELIREKYNNMCFICGKTQEENLTQYREKLSVHHTDLNKDAGCDDHEWKLVPLCKSCHGSSHTDPLKSRIEYLRADEECANV